MRPASRWLVLLLLIGSIVPAFAQRGRPAELTYIYVRGGDDVMMAGDHADLIRVRKALKPNERVFWVRTADRKEYVIRDVATLAELDQLWKDARALGEQQGKLGEQQGKLGEQQGKLGTRMGELGTRMGELATQRAKLAHDDPKHARLQRDIDDLEAQMEALEGQMRQLEKPMRALGKQMRELGKQHEVAVKQAEAGTVALVARAISRGAAKPF